MLLLLCGRVVSLDVEFSFLFVCVRFFGIAFQCLVREGVLFLPLNVSLYTLLNLLRLSSIPMIPSLL